MSSTTITRLRAVAVAIAPAVLLLAFAWHPHIAGRLPNDAAIAAAVEADPTRWGVAHLLTAVASALVALAFLAVRSHLREAGEERWSPLALPFVLVASTLYAVLPGFEFAPLAAAETGGDVAAAQGALTSWFLPVLVAGAVTFALGTLGFAAAIARSRVLSPSLTWLVVVALIVMAATRLVPLAAVQFWVQGVAALLALWPLVPAMWAWSPRPAGEPRSAPAM